MRCGNKLVLFINLVVAIRIEACQRPGCFTLRALDRVSVITHKQEGLVDVLVLEPEPPMLLRVREEQRLPVVGRGDDITGDNIAWLDGELIA
jgi:hypothetical protein